MRGERNLIKVGDRFDRLLVQRVWTEQMTTRKSKETFAECLCDCGNVIVTRGRYLRGKHKRSCNCWWKNTTAQNHHGWKGCGEISSTVWNGIKWAATRHHRIIPFEITIEEGWQLYLAQNRRCALTGVEIAFPKKARGIRTASLDRIDSLEGYTVGNVQWVHTEVNLMKMDLPQDRFVTWCRKIVAFSDTCVA